MAGIIWPSFWICSVAESSEARVDKLLRVCRSRRSKAKRLRIHRSLLQLQENPSNPGIQNSQTVRRYLLQATQRIVQDSGVHQSWATALSALTRQCLSRRIPTITALQKAVIAWMNARNKSQVGINWQFTATDARIKLKRLYPQIEMC